MVDVRKLVLALSLAALLTGCLGGQTVLDVSGTVGPTNQIEVIGADSPPGHCLEVDSLVITLQPVLMIGRMNTAYREDSATFVCAEASNPCWYYMELRDQATDEIIEYFYLSSMEECEIDASLTCDSRLEPDGRCEPFIRWVVMFAYIWQSVGTWDNSVFTPACAGMGWDVLHWEFTHPQMGGTWQIRWGKPGSSGVPTFSCQ